VVVDRCELAAWVPLVATSAAAVALVFGEDSLSVELWI
jgi:hypothetical protein